MTFLLKVEVGPKIGIGHLKRVEAIQSCFNKRGIDSYISCNSAKAVSTEFNESIIEASTESSYENEIIKSSIKFDHVVIDLSHKGSIDHPYKIISYCNYLVNSNISYSIIDGLGDDRLSKFMCFPKCENYFIPYIGSEVLDLTMFNFKNIYAGSSYAPVNTSINSLKEKKIINALPENILVTCGGSDPHLLTEKILKLLFKYSSNLNYNKIKVVIGPFYDHRMISDIQSLYTSFNVEFISGLTSLNDQYLWADLVITTIGMTRYECLSFNIPFIYFTYGVSPNYEPLLTFNSVLKYSYLGDLFFNTVNVPSLLQFFTSEEKFRQLSSNCENVIDLLGAQRISEALSK
ncbi:hypothetical protein [Prochlorococcus sp. MIT 1223]|uniref:hypothetical protein n=1 Tax=Prochlorococcus sp. MIT 1223 TaxID=3096217 RepID=UPI002A7541AE|nr:hypothetical protein [Prochlorococcus sp. MIT 1223]